ncbi:iron chaperone [Streptosporangium canum]|uniref:iron chaperone n=1 Tax=Streptosporangium canum TaxID=324952 RepID=UPI0037A922FA
MSAESKASEKNKRSKSSGEGFSEGERTAIKERAAELRADARRSRSADKAAVDERDVLAKIAEMAPPDRELAERIHAIVTTAAPDLAPKLWYGQPAYYKKGKLVCFFRSGHVDKERYSSFGFSVQANLDDDDGMWPTSYALTELSEAGEATIRDLVKKAVS